VQIPQNQLDFDCRFAKNGLMANSRLQVGQKIVYINQIPCPSTTINVIRLINQVMGTLQFEVTKVNWGATLAQGSPMKVMPPTKSIIITVMLPQKHCQSR
jgi:predicted RNA-binding protein with PUA domain